MKESKTAQIGKKALLNCDGIAISSIGASGGVMTLWDTALLELEVTFCSNNWILFVFCCKEPCLRFSIINLYMPVKYMDKIRC
jgi:hypothetical protein